MLAPSKLCSLAATVILATSGATAQNSPLQQAGLDRIDAMIKQRQTASDHLRREAAQWRANAEEAVKQRRWDRAYKAFGESAVRFPSFEALRGMGESVIQIRRARPTPRERAVAVRVSFHVGAARLRKAIAFARAVDTAVPPEELTRLAELAACLERYVPANGTVGQAVCEPADSILRAAR